MLLCGIKISTEEGEKEPPMKDTPKEDKSLDKGQSKSTSCKYTQNDPKRGQPLYKEHFCSDALHTGNPSTCLKCFTHLLSLTKSAEMKLVAEAEMSLKLLTGKEKWLAMMLSLVRSKESTWKGEVPPSLKKTSKVQ